MPQGHVNKDSLFRSHSLFMSLHSSLHSLDDSRNSQIIASLSGVFFLLPTPPKHAPFLLLSPAPYFHVSSLLSVFSNLQSLSLNLQAANQPSARRVKKKRHEGEWVVGREKGWLGRWRHNIL